MATQRLCSVDACGKSARARGLCRAHYTRWYRHGAATLGGVSKGALWQYLEKVVLRHACDDCLIWPYGMPKDGYPSITRNGVTSAVHRLVCEMINGPPPTMKHEAAHLCGNGHLGCINPRHLSWKTPKENYADRIDHGTTIRGSSNYRSILTEEQVLEIRRMVAAGHPRGEVAAMFGIKRDHVNAIINRRVWAWL